MASEWAMTAATQLLDIEGGEIYQSESGILLLAEAFNAAREQGRIEGLEEAFTLATEHFDHGDLAHADHYECVYALREQVRARIEELQK